MNRVYLAGQITGLTYEAGQNWRVLAGERLAEEGIEAFSPLRSKQYLDGQGTIHSGEYKDSPLSSAKGIVTRDYNDVKRADLIIVNIQGMEFASIGCCFEIAWAWEHKKPIILIDHPESIHTRHVFIKECVSYRVDNLDEAIQLAVSILKP